MKFGHRRSIRLKGYDYSMGGYYFVTICTLGRKMMFGEIVGFGENVGARRDAPFNNKTEMVLNENGKIVFDVWKTLPEHHDVILDEICIMPNHVHLILVIKNNNQGALENNNQGASRRAPTLGWMVGMFKTECTKQINKLNKTPGVQLFQRNYYERIIRNEKKYFKIKNYIKMNPKMWPGDRNNLNFKLKIEN